MKCRRPLWVYVVKDGLGAAILASIIVTLCRGTMPSNKTVWSYFPAGFTAFIGGLYLQGRFNPWMHIVLHQFITWLVFTTFLFLTCAALAWWDRRG
jgi:hypothetical protein